MQVVHCLRSIARLCIDPITLEILTFSLTNTSLLVSGEYRCDDAVGIYMVMAGYSIASELHHAHIT